MPFKPHPTDPDKVVYVPREYDLPAKIMTREEWLTYLDTTWKKCLADAWQKELDDMNRDDTIRMAREAGFNKNELAYLGDHFQRLVDLARADEREACAKLCEDKNILLAWPTYAAAIRARGQDAA